MKTSRDGRDLIQHFESCRLEAYPDPKTGGEPWTCGWGSTGPGVVPGTVWTQDEADEHFEDDLESRERELEFNTVRGFTQGQFDALVSFLFNVGPGGPGKDGLFRLKSGAPSTLWRKFKIGDEAGAADEFLKWINPGSNVSKGLLRRRVAERALFLGRDWRAALEAHIAAGG